MAPLPGATAGSSRRTPALRATVHHDQVASGQPNAIDLYGIPTEAKQANEDSYFGVTWEDQPDSELAQPCCATEESGCVRSYTEFAPRDSTIFRRNSRRLSRRAGHASRRQWIYRQRSGRISVRRNLSQLLSSFHRQGLCLRSVRLSLQSASSRTCLHFATKTSAAIPAARPVRSNAAITATRFQLQGDIRNRLVLHAWRRP